MIPSTAPEASSAPATARTCGNDEQRREHGDDDDHRHHRPTQDAVARLGAGAQLHPSHRDVDDLRQHDRKRRSRPRAMVARSQKGIDPLFDAGHGDSSDGSAAGEAVVVAVPERDLVLAEPPAEQHVLARRAPRGSRPGRSRGPSPAPRAPGSPRASRASSVARRFDLGVHLGELAQAECPPPLPEIRTRDLVGLLLRRRRARACPRPSRSTSGRTVGSSCVRLVRCEDPLHQPKV